MDLSRLFGPNYEELVRRLQEQTAQVPRDDNGQVFQQGLHGLYSDSKPITPMDVIRMKYPALWEHLLKQLPQDQTERLQPNRKIWM